MLFSLLVIPIGSTVCLNFLLVFPVPSKSHNILGVVLAKGLENAGHQVTMITPFPETDTTKNLTYLLLDDITDIKNEMEKNMSKGFFSTSGTAKDGFISNLMVLNKIKTMVNEMVLNSTAYKILMKSNERFDAIILEQFITEPLRGIIYHYNVPQIIFSPFGPHRWINKLVGNPQPISYIPDIRCTTDLHIWDRTANFIIAVFWEVLAHVLLYPSQNKILKKFYPKAPHLNDLLYNASLVLTYSHESINPAVPTVPNMINIGGFHINASTELPIHLKKIMDEANEGVIYFSFGSTVDPSYMWPQTIAALFKSFGTRKEIVLWKWNDDTLKGKPNNVIISKWFPQQAILAHPNCKLFITHAGLLSTIEAVYYGVPVLALPINGDQPLNAFQLTTVGMARTLQFAELTEPTLTETLDDLLYNPKYIEAAKFRSKLFRDRPIQPMELAIYWIEYVVKYQGAPHLRVAGVDLPLYKYLCLDIFAILFFSFSLIFYLLFKLCGCRQAKNNTKKG